MNLQWGFLSGFAAVVLNLLAIFGTARYRIVMRVWAVLSALAFAGFLAGPPVDQFVGAIVMIAMILGGAYLWLRH